MALISIHDDATSRLMVARFVERDNGAENHRAIIEYVRRHRRPLAVYTDHAGHFGQWLLKKGQRTDTIIARGLPTLTAFQTKRAREGSKAGGTQDPHDWPATRRIARLATVGPTHPESLSASCPWASAVAPTRRASPPENHPLPATRAQRCLRAFRSSPHRW